MRLTLEHMKWRSQRSQEVTEFKYAVRFDLRGHLEAVMSSEAIRWLLATFTLMPRQLRMLISNLRLNLTRGCSEVAMASEASKMAVYNMYIDSKVIKDTDFKSGMKYDLRPL